MTAFGPRLSVLLFFPFFPFWVVFSLLGVLVSRSIPLKWRLLRSLASIASVWVTIQIGLRLQNKVWLLPGIKPVNPDELNILQIFALLAPVPAVISGIVRWLRDAQRVAKLNVSDEANGLGEQMKVNPGRRFVYGLGAAVLCCVVLASDFLLSMSGVDWAYERSFVVSLVLVWTGFSLGGAIASRNPIIAGLCTGGIVFFLEVARLGTRDGSLTSMCRCDGATALDASVALLVALLAAVARGGHMIPRTEPPTLSSRGRE
jgi:hypothetical protein